MVVPGTKSKFTAYARSVIRYPLIPLLPAGGEGVTKRLMSGGVKKFGAQGRNRTGMRFYTRGILNPLRLPVSPPGLILKRLRLTLKQNSQQMQAL